MNKNRATGRSGGESLGIDELVVVHLPTMGERLKDIAGSKILALAVITAGVGLYEIGHVADAFVIVGIWYIVRAAFR